MKTTKIKTLFNSIKNFFNRKLIEQEREEEEEENDIFNDILNDRKIDPSLIAPRIKLRRSEPEEEE